MTKARTATITFKEVTRDAILFIEVTATGKIKATKKETTEETFGSL